MAEKRVDLLKNVYDKDQYSQTINTSFSEFGITTIAEDLEQQPSVEEFFGLYNSLFYDIPINGNTNSHEFLIQQSSRYANFEPSREEIEALQAEISQLRTNLLESQIRVAELETGQKINLPLDTTEESTQEVNNILNSPE